MFPPEVLPKLHRPRRPGQDYEEKVEGFQLLRYCVSPAEPQPSFRRSVSTHAAVSCICVWLQVAGCIVRLVWLPKGLLEMGVILERAEAGRDSHLLTAGAI